MPETVEKLRSAYLNNERTIWIRAPRNPATAGHLTIFLDGEFYRERLETGPIIDRLPVSVADSWFVFVSMQSMEARWIECPCYPPFAQFIVEELLPWLGEKQPQIAQHVRHRTIVGLSYTGLAAAFVAKEYPGVFHKVISQSGSFWVDDGGLAKAYAKLPGLLPTEFYLSVGTKETQRNVRHKEDVLQVMSQIEGVRLFRDALLARGITVNYVEFEGAHEFNAWARTLPAALTWALR